MGHDRGEGRGCCARERVSIIKPFQFDVHAPFRDEPRQMAPEPAAGQSGSVPSHQPKRVRMAAGQAYRPIGKPSKHYSICDFVTYLSQGRNADVQPCSLNSLDSNSKKYGTYNV